ncbi:glycosyltransferase family 2 protein [Hyunsoonleella aestuarii]|uniref:Glycosyltransferase family 2 protein n=1 Tax=Hyunsoonleella aestuarii TaxID=912802 RepID=A0ABP8E7E8_9FLAO|nr:glycosyltransferase family 2 protein [Hyunsoonleella aestuarii]
MKISVVSPIYKTEKSIQELVDRLNEVLAMLCDNFEIILVEDGSPDNSWNIIKEICKNDSNVKGIKLSRNFGQHNAITCGLNAARGDWIVVMDCDLQDHPEEIPNLFNKTKEGYDIVFAQREKRQDTFLKKFSSIFFYRILSYLTNTKQDATIANFGIYNKKVIQAVLSMNDYIRYFPTMVQWVGFKSTKIKVTHSSRFDGKSAYTFSKLLKLAFNIIISYSDKPLRLLVKFGLIISMLSFLYGLVYLYKYFNGLIEVLGFTSIIISITFLSGIIILTLGLVGIYVGKTFEQSKQRPTFLIEKKLNTNG